MKSTPLALSPQFDGTTLNGWLGRFWTQMCVDKALVSAYSNAQGLLSTQLHLNFLEAQDMLSYASCPVYHRVRWMPIVVRKSQRGTGNAVLFRVGMEPPVYSGTQPENSGYQYGAVFKVGGYAQPRGFVSYPIPRAVSAVASCICDSIVEPKAMLVNGTDFYVSDSTLLVRESKDMFDDARFARRQVALPDGAMDEEIMLWAADALVDRDILYQHFGYALGIGLPSSEGYQKFLSAMWHLYVSGGPEAVLRAAVAAGLGISAVESDETVETVLTDPATNEVLVVTDSQIYRYPAGSTVSRGTVPGAQLTAGTVPVETVRVFARLNSTKSAAERPDLEEYVPIVHIPPSMLAADTRFGVGGRWEPTPVLFRGLDTNGNPRFSTDLVGEPDDVAAVWDSLFLASERSGTSMAFLFPGLSTMEWTSLSDGTAVGHASPADFLVRNFLGANSAFVVIDLAHVAERAYLAHIGGVNNMIPVGSKLFIYARTETSPDAYDLSEGSAIVSGGAADSVSYRYLIHRSEQAGIQGSMTYRDSAPVGKYRAVCEAT